MLILGEAWGADEEPLRQPFVGESGKELFRMLGEALPDIAPDLYWPIRQLVDDPSMGLAWVRGRESWLEASGIAFTNVLNLRPPNNKILELCSKKADLPHDYPSSLPAISKGYYLRPEYLPELDRLREEITLSTPNLIIAAGNTACWTLLHTTNISSIRGTTTIVRTETNRNLPLKVLPTYHPAGVLYQWSWRPIVIADLMKAGREAKFPEIRRPRRSVLVSPTLSELRNWVSTTLSNPPPLLACDIETSLGMIDTIGFGRSSSEAIVIPFGPHRVKRGNNYNIIWPVRDGKPRPSYWEPWEELEAWKLCFQLLEHSVPKLGQNFIYDLQYLLRMGVQPRNCLEDSMLLHHAMFPEMQKSLGFLGSVYTDEQSWKLMHRQSDSEKRDE